MKTSIIGFTISRYLECHHGNVCKHQCVVAARAHSQNRIVTGNKIQKCHEKFIITRVKSKCRQTLKKNVNGSSFCNVINGTFKIRFQKIRLHMDFTRVRGNLICAGGF